MDAALQEFRAELARDPEVRAVLLFGSHARGDPRPDSDVDLLVITRERTGRGVERRGGTTFELVYATEAGAVEFWAANRDDCVALWETARVLHDREGTVDRLRAAAERIRTEGKRELSDAAREHFEFDARDSIRAAAALTDSATASLVLHATVDRLTALVFDLAGEWTPPPKQRLPVIRAKDEMLHEGFVRFYGAESLAEKLPIAEDLVDRVFDAVP